MDDSTYVRPAYPCLNVFDRILAYLRGVPQPPGVVTLCPIPEHRSQNIPGLRTFRQVCRAFRDVSGSCQVGPYLILDCSAPVTLVRKLRWYRLRCTCARPLCDEEESRHRELYEEALSVEIAPCGISRDSQSSGLVEEQGPSGHAYFVNPHNKCHASPNYKIDLSPFESIEEIVIRHLFDTTPPPRYYQVPPVVKIGPNVRELTIKGPHRLVVPPQGLRYLNTLRLIFASDDSYQHDLTEEIYPALKELCILFTPFCAAKNMKLPRTVETLEILHPGLFLSAPTQLRRALWNAPNQRPALKRLIVHDGSVLRFALDRREPLQYPTRHGDFIPPEIGPMLEAERDLWMSDIHVENLTLSTCISTAISRNLPKTMYHHFRQTHMPSIDDFGQLSATDMTLHQLNVHTDDFERLPKYTRKLTMECCSLDVGAPLGLDQLQSLTLRAVEISSTHLHNNSTGLDHRLRGPIIDLNHLLSSRPIRHLHLHRIVNRPFHLNVKMETLPHLKSLWIDECALIQYESDLDDPASQVSVRWYNNLFVSEYERLPWYWKGGSNLDHHAIIDASDNITMIRGLARSRVAERINPKWLYMMDVQGNLSELDAQPSWIDGNKAQVFNHKCLDEHDITAPMRLYGPGDYPNEAYIPLEMVPKL